jgi:hypothetical protein
MRTFVLALWNSKPQKKATTQNNLPSFSPCPWAKHRRWKQTNVHWSKRSVYWRQTNNVGKQFLNCRKTKLSDKNLWRVHSLQCFPQHDVAAENYTLIITVQISKAVTVGSSSKTWTVFVSSNTMDVGSNPTRGIDLFVVYYVFVLFCV